MKIHIEFIEEILASLYNHIISNINVMGENTYKKAMIYLSHGDIKAAKELILINFINNNQKQTDYLILIYINLLEGKLNNSIRMLKYLETNFKYDKYYTKTIGDIYFSLSNYDDALKSYKRFILYEDYNEDTVINLANTYLALGEWKKALHLYEKLPKSLMDEKNKTNMQICSHMIKPQITSINVMYVSDDFGFIDIVQISSLNIGPGIYCTGNVDDSIKETALVALNYLKNKRYELGLKNIDNMTFHIHLPRFYSYKTGASIGVSIAMGLYIYIKGLEVKNNWAYTGEVDMEGNVYPVGSIKEKVEASYLNNIETIFIPKDNLEELKTANFPSNFIIISIKNIKEVIEYYERYY